MKSDYYETISTDLNVQATGTTWLGSEIADPNRIIDYANYYLSHTVWPPGVLDDLAQAVWESAAAAWLNGTPTSEELQHAARVLQHAQDNDSFCWYLATQVLFGTESTEPFHELKWLFGLPDLDLALILKNATNQLKSITGAG